MPMDLKDERNWKSRQETHDTYPCHVISAEESIRGTKKDGRDHNIGQFCPDL